MGDQTAGAIADAADGGCLCGAIRFRVTGAPVLSIICHCRSCQKACAAPSVGWLSFRRQNLQWLRGAPAWFQSSPPVTRGFCGRCGTPLTYVISDQPGLIDVTTASFDDPGRFPPSCETWVSHHVSWQPLTDGLPRYPRGSDDGPADGRGV